MEKILISLLGQLAIRMKGVIPMWQRSKVFTQLIEQEIESLERALYECALAVEKSAALEREMKDWDIALEDGLTDGL